MIAFASIAREVDALDRLADALAEHRLAATLWQVQGVEPLAQSLLEQGDAGSDPARVAFTDGMLAFMRTHRALREAVEAAQAALDMEGNP